MRKSKNSSIVRKAVKNVGVKWSVFVSACNEGSKNVFIYFRAIFHAYMCS